MSVAETTYIPVSVACAGCTWVWCLFPIPKRMFSAGVRRTAALGPLSSSCCLSATLRVATVDSRFIRFWPTRIALAGKSFALAGGKPWQRTPWHICFYVCAILSRHSCHCATVCHKCAKSFISLSWRVFKCFIVIRLLSASLLYY